jgi:tRNA(fMet)-specific endonuclease VapC
VNKLLVDTTLLIDFFRKKNKQKTSLTHLWQAHSLYVSVITVYEFQVGANSPEQLANQNEVIKDMGIIALDSICTYQAILLYQTLKRTNSRIGFADTLIAATALAHEIPVATLNKEHFERVPNLTLINIPTE